MSPASSTNSLPVSPLTEEPLPFKVKLSHEIIMSLHRIYDLGMHAAWCPHCNYPTFSWEYFFLQKVGDIVKSDLQMS